MRNRCLAFFLEVSIPEIAIQECDDEARAQKKCGRACMISPPGSHTVERSRGIKSQGEAKELEEEAEAHARAPFKPPADCEGGKKRPDEDDSGQGRFLDRKT